MKTVLLITTILITTPEKDFSGMMVEELTHMVDCTMQLKTLDDVNLEFNGVMTLQVKHKCEAKKLPKNYSIDELNGQKLLSIGVIITNQNGE